MNTNNGGPAFPGEKAERFGQSNDYSEGMTLRDYFAAKAMAALIVGDKDFMPLRDADVAYDIADAMLLERAKQGDAA